MEQRVVGWRGHLLSWVSLFALLVGLLSWAPVAMAEDGSLAGDPPIEETVVTTEVPADPPPAEPVQTVAATDPPLPPSGDGPGVQSFNLNEEEGDDPPAAISVTGLALQCETVSAEFKGAMTLAEPVAAGSVELTVRTTDDPAITPLQTITVSVEPGQAYIIFDVVLEPGDYEASTTKEFVVAGPGGTPVSKAVSMSVVNGATVCQPEESDPTPTATATATPTETAVPSETATAPAINTGTVINTNGANLNCRTQPTTSSGVIMLLAPGAKVDVRGAHTNGWVPVTCGGQDGFVSGAYLLVTTTPGTTPTATATATTPAPGGATVATVSNTGGLTLRCRTAPNTNSTIITQLYPGAQVATRGNAANGWVPVTCGGQAGFVSVDYVVLGGGTVTTPTPTAPGTTNPEVPSTGNVAYVTGTGGAGLRCRTAPVSGEVVTVLPENTRIEIQSQSDGWAQISCAGQTGWVSMTYVLFTVSPGAGGGAVWIDVNLSTQYMIVYQGNNVLGRTYVSTGRRGFDTPPGTHYISLKVKMQDMSGVLGGEYYHVKDVPDVLYFTTRGHAIHGAYWHNNFGYVMSHGCINLPVGFAAWLYNITPLGTRVVIHW